MSNAEKKDDGAAAEPRNSSFLFIADAVEIEPTCLPSEIGHGFTIDRATQKEIKTWIRPWTKAHLARFDVLSQPSAERSRYEGKWVKSDADEVRTIKMIPEDKWRYYVIRHIYDDHHDQKKIHAIQQVSRLLEVELVPAFHVVFLGDKDSANQKIGGTAELSKRLSTQLGHRALPSEIPRVDEETISTLTRLFSKRLLLKEFHEPIIQALNILDQSDDLDRKSPMWLLSHFVSLEAALTHAPSLGDPNDSIGRQLRSSIPLLLRRSNELDLLERIGITAPLDTALKKLYVLRSRIAHGERPWPRSSQELAALGNMEKAVKAIQMLSKAILRQALYEPDLVCDLKGPKK